MPLFLLYTVNVLFVILIVWLLSLRFALNKKNRILRDEIANRMKIEKELKENELKFHNLVHRIGEGIAVVDGNEVFLFANEAADDIYDVEHGKLQGRSVFDFISTENIQKIKTETEKRNKGESSVYELDIVTEKGNAKTLMLTVTPNYNSDGNVVASYGVFKDITEIKTAQVKLKENEELFRTLLNNAPLPIFYKSNNGKYLGCNEEFEKFIGKSESEIVGKTVYDLSPKGIADKYFEKDNLLFESGEKQIYEWKAVDKGGTERSVVYHKAALRDFVGNISGLIGAIVDITETKNHEKLLKQKQIELERSNNDLEQFAYTVSHDLQEPLRMVSGFTDLLKKKYASELNSEALSYISYSVEGAKRMQAQIQGILMYSRISTQANPFENISLNEVIEYALKNLSEAVKESGAEVKYGRLPMVFGDLSQLTSVFQNLIGNSLKFRKQGLIPEIVIESKEIQDHNKIEISVKDNGIGIDRKHFENIFLIFHRLHSQDKYPGTGIGLSVCKKIIERHGGEIRVESEINSGTTFYFTLKSGV